MYEGREVIILSLKGASSKYTPELVGKEGLVAEKYHTPDGLQVGVKLADYYNSMSANGYFWFPIENLKEKEGTIIMEKNTKYYKLCRVNNEDEESIGGFAEDLYKDDLHEGDIVVVNYSYKGGNLSVRKVVSYLPNYTDDYVSCTILGTANLDAYLERERRKARRKERERRKARRKELKEQMIAQAKKYQEEYWRVISETDTTMKALYTEFKELDN